jgi:Mor family transcriptional regulator
MPLTFPDKYPETLQLVAQAVNDYLVNHHLATPQEAALAAFGAAENVRKAIGGGASYIPKGYFYEKHEEHRQIFERFNGRNGVQLAREAGLTVERIRQIVSEQSALDRAARQVPMFPEEEDASR